MHPSNNNNKDSEENLTIYVQSYDLNNLEPFLNRGEPYDVFSNVADVDFLIYLKFINYDYSNKRPYISCCHPRNLEAAYQGIRYLCCSTEYEKALHLINNNFNPLNKDDLNQIDKWISQQVDPDIKTRSQDVYLKKINFHQYAHHTISEMLMYDLLLCKFTQHPELLKALLDTSKDKPRKIVAQTETYYYGSILIKLRNNLHEELTKYKKIFIRTGLSETITMFLPFIYDQQHEKNDKYITEEELKDITPCITIVDYKNKELKNINTIQSKKTNANTDNNARIENTKNFTAVNKINPRKNHPQQCLFATSKVSAFELEKNEETPLLENGLGPSYGSR